MSDYSSLTNISVLFVKQLTALLRTDCFDQLKQRFLHRLFTTKPGDDVESC